MSTPYTPTPVVHETIDIPDDSTDDINSTKIGAPLEQLADTQAAIRLPATENDEVYPLAARTIQRFAGPPFGANLYDGTIEMPQVGGSKFEWTAVDAAHALEFPADLPEGAATPVVFGVYLEGATGHGALPAFMPQVIFRVWSADGTLVDSSFKTDTSATVEAYEALHVVSGSCALTGGVVNRELYFYTISVAGETSTNALVGMTCYRPTWSVIVDAADPGAG